MRVVGRGRVVAGREARLTRDEVVNLAVAVVVDAVGADGVRRVVGVERAGVDERVVVVAIPAAHRPSVAVVIGAVGGLAVPVEVAEAIEVVRGLDGGVARRVRTPAGGAPGLGAAAGLGRRVVAPGSGVVGGRPVARPRLDDHAGVVATSGRRAAAASTRAGRRHHGRQPCHDAGHDGAAGAARETKEHGSPHTLGQEDRPRTG